MGELKTKTKNKKVENWKREEIQCQRAEHVGRVATHVDRVGTMQQSARIEPVVGSDQRETGLTNLRNSRDSSSEMSNETFLVMKTSEN